MAAARTLTRAALGRAALPMMMTEQRASPLLLALARSSGAGPRTTETFHKSPHAPSRRGASTSSTAATSDRIHMRGLVFYAYHGVYPEEEKLGKFGCPAAAAAAAFPPRLLALARVVLPHDIVASPHLKLPVSSTLTLL